MHAKAGRAPNEPIGAVTLSREQVRRVDQIATEQLGIPGIVLMENAAIALCEAAHTLIEGGGLGRAEILCGPGNNGGDGFALARHLSNRLDSAGFEIRIVLAAVRDRYRGDALTNLDIIGRMGLEVSDALAVSALDPGATAGELGEAKSTLVIDALLGTGAMREPSGVIAQLVRRINHLDANGATVLAVDIPTGLDCDTGAPLGDAALVVRADLTVTLCAMKPGLAEAGAAQYCGRVVVGDIGVPGEVLRTVAGASASDQNGGKRGGSDGRDARPTRTGSHSDRYS